MPMHAVFASLPLVAAFLAVPQFLPQLARVRRTGTVAGVSWSWAALTSVNNAAWLAYFALSGFWTALVPAVSATVLAAWLALVLARRRGGGPARGALVGGAGPARGGAGRGGAERADGAQVGVGGGAGPRRCRVRPGGAGLGFDRRVPAPGRAVGVDGVPVPGHGWCLPGHLAADLR